MREFVYLWVLVAAIGLSTAAIAGAWLAFVFGIFRLLTGYPT